MQAIGAASTASTDWEAIDPAPSVRQAPQMTSTGIENGQGASAPVAGVAGERGVVALATDAVALRAVGEAVVADGTAIRAALHTPLDAGAGSPAALLRCVGDTARLAAACGEVADLGSATIASRYLRRHRRVWELGQPTPGLGTVFFCHKRADLTAEEFHRRWTSSHGPLALRHHMGMWDYDQVSVLEVHHGDVLGPVAGIAVVQWPSHADLTDRFFDGDEGAAAIRADAGSFTDLDATVSHLMTETVLGDPDPVTATGPCWLTDHRSVGFDRPVADVWAVVGDFGAILEWWPGGLATCVASGEGVGAIRRLTRDDGGIVVEVLRHHRDGEAMIELELTDGLPSGVVRYRCRYEVRADGDGSRLDWQPTALVDLGGAPVFGAMVDRGWDSVRTGLGAALSR